MHVLDTYFIKKDMSFIEDYHEFSLTHQKITEKLELDHETIYRVIKYFKNHNNERIHTGWMLGITIGIL